MNQTHLHSSKRTLLHLSLIDGIGPVTIKKLLAFLPESMKISDLYQLRISDFIYKIGLSSVVSQKIAIGLADSFLLEREIDLINKYHVNITTVGCLDYPYLLSKIYAPPIVLYWLGKPVFNEQKVISIIGSRSSHRYAEEAIDEIVPGLINNGWIIVSGGAIGADSMAHRAAIQSGGKTVVVLGSGVLCPYPASNRNLFKSIIDKGGALVSSFSLMTEARPGNFPVRNRIISGLSRGCIVAQAARKSGTRITAQFALDQGRELFAIPGPIGDPLSEGCHALIQEGAKLVSSVEDIFEEFADFKDKKRVKLDVKKVKLACRIIKNEEKIVFKNDVNKLDGLQGIIFSKCKIPQSSDNIALSIDISLEKAQEFLFDLQLNGHIKQDFAGLWEQV